MQDKAKTLSEQDRGKQMALQGMLAAKEYDEAMDSEGNVSEEKLKEIAKRHNLKPEDLPNMRNVLLAAEGRKAQERALGLAHKLGGQAVAEMGRIQATGIARFEDDKVTIDKDFAKQAGLDKGGIAYMSSMLKATAYEGKMAGATDADEAVGLQRQGLAARKQATEALEGMSVAEKRRLAQGLAKSGAFGQAGDVSAAAARHDSFAKNVSRKGVGGAAASALGITLSKEEQDALKGMNFNFGKDQDAAARLLAEKMGVGDQDDVLKDIKRALSSSQEGGKGVAKGADLLASVGGLKSVQDAQKKKREEAQAEKDPLQAKIAGLLEKVADATGKTAAALSGTLSVVDKSAGAADPDAKGGTK
jgi:hypothetical protein